MGKPFDIGAVDALLLNAINALHDEALEGDALDLYDVESAATAAAVVLTDKERFFDNGESGFQFVEAGFVFAMRLCLAVLADPLHLPASERTEADWREARKLVLEVYKHQDEMKEEQATREPVPVA